MKNITAQQLREKYLSFFKDKGHQAIPSASLIPENDPTVLFTTAGMHPLVPYLLGAQHPMGKRLANVQKCVRTGDIDEVGDPSHLSLFEMLGNWSLGDYFKEEAIAWSWEFLTSPDYLGIPADRLAFTVFEGDADAPRDEESYNLWIKMGVSPERIFFLPKENNWWGPAGQTGPCGSDTEMFMIMDKEPCGPDCSPACSCGRYLEIWNNVFMQYNKTADGAYEPLLQKNVDTGMGLERALCVFNGFQSVYDTELFDSIIAEIGSLAGKDYKTASQSDTRAFRIIADHMRAAVFIMGDERGVSPSNVDQGYVLRRLIRRAIRYSNQLGIAEGSLSSVAKRITVQYSAAYPELSRNEGFITEQLRLEEERFQRTVKQGIKEYEKLRARLAASGQSLIDGVSAFRLYDTFGFPIEMTVELALENGLAVDTDGFNESYKKHQELSQAGAAQRFKGGLADSGEQTARLHTATHIMLASLKKVLGEDVNQKGSNITAERLRFDFSFPRKMTPEEIKQVESLVNEAIQANIPVEASEMTVDEAKAAGATGVFESRYGERVTVYRIGDVSCEICGGPHAGNTGELGAFVIQKEESSSAGVRRIKAVLG